ncbi:hypothetical protein [Devosia sp. 2618]|uniref:hypothetical protein n=1 Tax=Devosia sp. 2618 TaxID=3156454 RepID=UPI003397F37F
MHTKRTMSREIGTALAVLAIYLLTMLAPLHQARASQVAFQQLGYVTLDAGWVLCNPIGAEGNDRDVLVAKCPANGVGKTDIALPVFGVLTAPLTPSPAAIARPNTARFFPVQLAPPGGPRGPPVLV